MPHVPYQGKCTSLRRVRARNLRITSISKESLSQNGKILRQALLSVNGENHADTEVLVSPLLKLHHPPVGRGNLGHQPQAGSVGGSAIRIQLAVSIYRPTPRRCTTPHEQDKVCSCTPSSKPDGAAGGVVPHAVGEQIVDGPPQQEGIGFDWRQSCLRQFHFQFKALPARR